MLRSVLGTGQLVTVYRAALSIATPGGGNWENVPPPNTKLLELREWKSTIKKFQNVKFLLKFS